MGREKGLLCLRRYIRNALNGLLHIWISGSFRDDLHTSFDNLQQHSWGKKVCPTKQLPLLIAALSLEARVYHSAWCATIRHADPQAS
jgi:hypothetical protein